MGAWTRVFFIAWPQWKRLSISKTSLRKASMSKHHPSKWREMSSEWQCMLIKVYIYIYIFWKVPHTFVYNSFRFQFSSASPPQLQPQIINMSAQQNSKGQGVSHATDSSVPSSIQEKVPQSVEDELPDSVHNTGSNDKTGKVRHATGPKGSKVPQVGFNPSENFHVC